MNSELEHDLVERLNSIEVAEAADGDIVVLTQQLQLNILSKVSAFLADNAGLVPNKEVLTDLVSKAIDTAFTALNRPFLTTLLKPIVKAQILALVGRLYDGIFSNRTEV